ncbi:MAG: LysR family transcriptional regulator [Gammaproteobacteria bacterium]|nr:LysR family transcriptional regulator [Gammaproteobacteria bacterium]
MPKPSPRIFSALIYFEACGRLLSFSAAARELHLTTGAVSQQIRKLEQQLALQLFIRHGQGVELTPAGNELLAVMQQSVGSISAVLARLQVSPASDVIRLKSTPSLVFKWLIPKLQQFKNEFPQLKIETYADAALLDLTRDDFDLAIDYSTGDYQHVTATLLMSEQLLPVASPEYVAGLDLANQQVWDQISLLHDSMPWAGAARDAEWRYWLDRSGLNSVASEQGHYFNRSDMAIAAAEAGLGVALARRSLVTTELTSGRLISPWPMVDSCCDYYLLLPKRQVSNQQAKTAQAWLLTQV